MLQSHLPFKRNGRRNRLILVQFRHRPFVVRFADCELKMRFTNPARLVITIWVTVLLFAFAFGASLLERYGLFDDRANAITPRSRLLNQRDCQCKPITTDRIVGGQELTNLHLPWQASIRVYGQHNCGGTILNERQVLTAAHCVYKYTKEDLQVVVGMNYLHDKNAATFRVEKLNWDFDYSRTGRQPDEAGDIAVITIVGHFDFKNQLIKPACIDSVLDHEYGILMASGWGYVLSNIRSPFGSSPNHISDRLKKAYFYYRGPDSGGLQLERQCGNLHLVCLDSVKQGDSICDGDSGGPLHSRFSNKDKSGLAVIGVAGFVTGNRVGNILTKFCNGPSFYQRIAYYKDFLNLRVGKRNVCWVDAKPSEGIDEITN